MYFYYINICAIIQTIVKIHLFKDSNSLLFTDRNELNCAFRKNMIQG